MMKGYSWAVALAAGLLLGATTLAIAQTASSNAISLSEPWSAIQTWLLTVVGTVVSSLIGYVSTTLNKKLGISIDDSLRNALQTATTNAAGLVLNKIGNQLQGQVLDIGAVGNDVVQYVIKNVPDAVGHFQLDEERVKNMILAKVPQIANTMLPAPPTSQQPVV